MKSVMVIPIAALVGYTCVVFNLNTGQCIAFGLAVGTAYGIWMSKQ